MRAPAAEAPSSAPRASGIQSAGAALAGSVLVAVLVTWPLAARLTSAVPIPRYLIAQPWRHIYWFEIWSLWLVRHLPLARLQFTTNLIFHPVGIAIPWASQSLSTAIAAVPFERAFGLVAAANLFTIAGLALAAYATFLLGRHVTGSDAAAFVAGVIFASAPIVTANAQGHLYVVTALFEVPLYLLFLLKMLERPTPAHGLYTGTVFALSLFSYWYCPVFLAVYTGVIVTVDLVRHRRSWRDIGHLARAAAASALVVVPALAVVAVPFFVHAARLYPSGSLEAPVSQMEAWSVDLLAFLVPAYDHWLLGRAFTAVRASFGGNPTLQTDYVGWFALVCAALAIGKPGRARALPWIWSAVAFLLLALGPVLHVSGRQHFALFGRSFSLPLPHAFVYALPPFSGVRDLSMYSVPLMLAIAILAGIGLHTVIDRLGRAARNVAVAGALGLVFADFAILPFPLVTARAPVAYDVIAADSTPGSVVELPWSTTTPVYDYYQTVHGRPLLTAYLNRLDPWYVGFARGSPVVRLFAGRVGPEAVSRSSADEFLRFFDVRYIVVHEQIAGEEEFKRLTAAVPAVFPAHLVEGRDGISVYRVDAPAAATLPVTFDFSSEQPDPGLSFGWSDPEQRDGVSTAWVDGRRSSVWFDLPRAEHLVATMRVEPISPRDGQSETIAVSVDDRAAGTIRPSPGWGTYTVDLPAGVVHPGSNRLDFTYPFCTVPAATAPGSRDDRCLSVAFDFIRIDSPAAGRK